MKKTIIIASVVVAVCVVIAAGVIAYIWTRPCMKLPADFVRVERRKAGPYEVRAIAADGTVVGLRRQWNPENGSLKFWTEAVKRELTDGRGYAATAEEDVKADNGTPGRLMKFSANPRGQDAVYLVALFVTNGDVLVAEAGGTADAMKTHEGELRKCLLSAR